MPGHVDSITGSKTVNGRAHGTERRLRAQVNASLSHHARDFILGNHDFKFGVEFERSRTRSSGFFNDDLYYLDSNGAPYYRYLWQGYDFVNYNHRTSTFAQDSWSLTDKLTLDLGVRWDHNRGIIPGRGAVFATDPVAPRLGFTFDVKGDQKTVIKAHYGKYYEGLFQSFYFYANDQPDFEGQYFYYGNWYTGSVVNETSSVDPAMRQPYIDQMTFGVEQQLPLEIALSAHYIQRRWHDLIDLTNTSAVFEPVPFVNPVTGETITVYSLVDPGNGKNVLTNPASYFWRYDGLELIANRRFEKLYLGASLFLSRARGSIPNLPNLNFPLKLDLNPNQRINAIGRQLNDPTLEFQIQGSYSFPWGINTGWFFRHETGDTWAPTVSLPRGVVSPGGRRILALPRGAFRLPAHNLLDLRVEKAFPTGAGQLRFTADIFNVFNNAFATSVQDRFENEDFGEPTGFNSPREIRLGLRYTF